MSVLADIPPERIPRHIAIIMDGNGRWAVRRGLERVRGHQQGAQHCSRRSSPNAPGSARSTAGRIFSRSIPSASKTGNGPPAKSSFLMQMYIDYLRSERATMMENNIRFRQIGRLENLPDPVLEEVNITLEADARQRRPDAGAGAQLRQPGRDHRCRPHRSPSRSHAASCGPKRSTKSTISEHLYTAGMPDPDLLIRTAGEMRVSNYLLWQISYAELFVSDVLWPDFGIDELHEARSALSPTATAGSGRWITPIRCDESLRSPRL